MADSESRTNLALDRLAPLAPARNRSRDVADRLQAEILSGKIEPGAKLPTEAELMAAMGVSRTVIREAVAALRAEGLVVTRQGVGAFVAADVRERPFRIDADELSSLAEVVHVMELRTGIEVEAAGIAAERAGSAEIRRIGTALKALDRAIAEGEAAVDQDFRFHFAIAEATGNPQFTRFLEFLGRFVPPRQNLRPGAEQDRRGYLEMIQGEHRRIFQAIEGGNPTAARAAMRKHLEGSRQRYSRLAAKAQQS
ncbi:FadR/GntR family transcriptional regulator [Desertibaculum subflavum]|uniref:FadR/GntR family transcriptional regulator n=1 Tax=Desertibaculum subflavum TaxID=2268458 RepID=UPI000E668FE5